VRPRLYIESVGKRSCAMGWFGRGLEFWSWPLKLLSNYKASVWLSKTLEMVDLETFVGGIVTEPASTTVRYGHPLFSIDETIFSPIDFPGCFLLYTIVSSVDLEIIFHFKPELNLMWPGAIGGQYCYWSDEIKGFVISEPTDSFSSLIRTAEAEKFSKEGDHAFAENFYSFKVPVKAGKKEFVVSIIGGVMGKKACQELLGVEEKIQEEIEVAKDYYRTYLEQTTKLKTPDQELNEFFTWGKLSLVKGITKNPKLGEALVAGIGPSGKSTRPGFAWFFAGDASINSLAMCDYGDKETVKKSLEFYASYQSSEGRIPHEISQSHGLIDWFSNYKGFAFLHADTTAWFLLACAHYVIRTNDTDFFMLMKEKILKSLDFYDTMCDETGLIVNLKAGLGALEISEFRRPKYDLYTNTIYLAALEKLKSVFANVGEGEICERLDERIRKVKQSIEKIFWSEEKKAYYMSVNTDGKLFDYLTPWPSFGISLSVLDEDRSKAFVKILCNSTTMTRWGS
ncbi:MAG: amylo-alpha-1,6-glucosidase, partial [Pseudothermotoga sp.]